LSRYNSNGSEEHNDMLHHAMRYTVSTPLQGLKLSPVGELDGNPGWKFEVKEFADASYKPYQDTTTSVGRLVVLLQIAPNTKK
jgi:hypothetical protein